jgi:cell division protein FtsZ
MTQRKTAVIGLGGGGCQIIDCLVEASPGDRTAPAIVAVNTDTDAISRSRATTKLQIGSSLTNGHGTGADSSLGRKAAEEDIEMIRNLVEGMDFIFLVVGLGGGTGSGGASVILEAARDADVTSLCIATLPFEFEGRTRKSQAEEAVTELQKSADALIVIPNERLFEFTGEAAVADSFARADQILADAIRAIWNLVMRPGVINISFADLQKIVRSSSGICTLGVGDGSGENKAGQALDALLENPLLRKGEVLATSPMALVSIMGGPELALKELDKIMKGISAALRPDAEMFMGTVVDDAWKDRVTVTLVACEHWRVADEPERADETPAEIETPKSVRRKRRRKDLQTKLQFDSASGRGRFRDVEPTIMDGQDLDVPTFVRRGIQIEK